MAIDTIVVGVDGSEDSLRAVEWTADLAAITRSEVTAVHALGLLERFGQETVPVESHKEAISHRFEVDWCAPLFARHTNYRCELVYGPPVPAILRIAKADRADLIVVGSRGVGGFNGLLLGSTSSQLVQHASCPITVIPRGD